MLTQLTKLFSFSFLHWFQRLVLNCLLCEGVPMFLCTLSNAEAEVAHRTSCKTKHQGERFLHVVPLQGLCSTDYKKESLKKMDGKVHKVGYICNARMLY